MEEGQALVCRERVCGVVEDGALLCGRAPEARARALRYLQSDDQQLQAAGARLRSAGEPGVQLAQSLGGHPYPDLQRESQGEAPGVSSAGSRGQSISGVLRAAAGGVGWDT